MEKLLIVFILLFYISFSSFHHNRRLATIDEQIIPNLAHQTKQESNYLKLHKCRDTGEAYAAAYLITKEHLLYQHTAYNLTWVNCEMGSFIMMQGNANPQKEVNGSLVQSLDVLDFSVIHLSAYERLQRRWGHIYRTLPKKTYSVDNLQPIADSASLLKEVSRLRATTSKSIIEKVPELNRTVAIMPFLAADMGAGHSKLGNRLQYLHACFWSIYTHIPHIVAYVKNDKDYEYAKFTSNLPFFDVVLLEGLPKSASLPVASVQQTKERILDGRWDFDFIYFTESDQILLMRHPDVLYSHLLSYPRRLLVPHRLMPYPDEILHNYHNRSLATEGALNWFDMSCCLPRQNCMDRKLPEPWQSVKNTSVAVLRIFGLQVPLGNCNFHQETYRVCQLYSNRDLPYCP